MYKLEVQDRTHKRKDLQTYLYYFALISIQVSQVGTANFAKFKIVFLTQEHRGLSLCVEKVGWKTVPNTN